MAILGTGRIFSDPRTDEHLRFTLSQIQQNNDAVVSDLTGVELRLDLIEDVLGKETVIFDSTMVAGQPVYTSSNDNVDLADASALATSMLVGLAFSDATATNSGEVLTNGVLQLSDWTNIIGSTNLTSGSTYYLSTTAGELTTTPPSVAGEIVAPMGIALSSIDFNIIIGTRIKL